METQGRSFSILGDSISTYHGYSNDASRHPATGSNAVAYGPSKMRVTETWWYRLISCDGMRLCVNNSYSGSCVGHGREGGADTYRVRWQYLSDETHGISPDCIFVFMGANDYKNGDMPVGEAGSGEDTFAGCYARMLRRICAAYPQADVFCMSVLPNRFTERTRRDEAGGLLARYNVAIAGACGLCGASFIDLADTGINYENCPDYYLDGLHPNVRGMEKIYLAVSAHIREYERKR